MRAGRVLIISENAPVPADRRVWNISRTLTAAGWQVVIACAQGPDRDDAPHEVLEGIEIHRYPLRPAGSTLGYAREYGQALWRLRKLVRRLSRDRHFDGASLAPRSTSRSITTARWSRSTRCRRTSCSPGWSPPR